jgi:PAS domain S-box-containing protein
MNDHVLRILIVDDNPEDRAEMRRLLLTGSEKRFRFTEAETGASALRACLENEDGPPDCVLLDYHLPDYDAPELLAALGGLDSPCCPVLVVTGSSVSVYGSALLQLGAQDFIGKSWMNPESLARSVENAIERHRLGRELKSSQERFKAFLENSATIAWMKDHEGRYVYLSSNFEKRFNIRFEDWSGKTDFDVWPHRVAEQLRKHDQEVLASNHSVEIMEEAQNADGSSSWWLSFKFPFTDATGQRFVGGLGVDITERKFAEEELRNTETRLALVIEEVKAGYWDWDLKTKEVYLSPEWKRQIGFNENELLNRWEEWQCRLHPDDRALVSAATENFIAGLHPVFEVEFRLLHKDGSYRWIHSRGGLLRDQNNHPYRMLGINLDITVYKKTKELNERREKMEQSFRLYVASQTTAAIAHELNQPLAAISSYADVALHMLQTGNRNPQKLSHVLENCALQAQRAGDVIRQLMTVLHKGETINEPIDINISVREALALVKADVELGAFKIELDLAAGLPQVSANGLQIQKVLVNLLHNGLESMQESGINAGTMKVTTRSSTGAPAMAQVTVCDSGKGVADTAILRTMFQPFHTTKPAGLGMGLAISRALVEAYGGKMWAEQNAGMGISVHFTLPFVT